jgi:alanyl-tRNA synthetase
MTRKLYYEDPQRLSFEARPIEQRREGERWAVVLDQTCFYPQGGGQPADRGSLNGRPVLDVRLDGEAVAHLLAEPLADELVRGEVDPAWRFDFMQQHTGQHLVSGALLQAAGAATLSAHLGESTTTVELDAPRLEEALILEAEDLANRTIAADLPVRIHWVDPEDVHRFSLRKPPPSRERIRIVEIEGFDTVACSGIHLSRTAQAGLVRWVGEEKIRGRLRLHWKIGRRALEDYRRKDRLAARLSRELTCSVEEIPEAVRRLQERLKEQGLALARLEEGLAGSLAERLLAGGREAGGRRLVAHRFERESPGLVRRVFDLLLERERTVAALLLPEGERLQWMVGQSAGGGLELKRIVPPLLPAIEGRGGGNELRWQGVGRRPAGAEEFLARLEEALRRPPFP